MHKPSPPAHDTVFERTSAGQLALLSVHSALNAAERRLLSVVNGFTPLSALRALLGEDEVSPAVIQKMAASGLIGAPVQHTQHFFFGWPCGKI
jgi:hypothetical protein